MVFSFIFFHLFLSEDRVLHLPCSGSQRFGRWILYKIAALMKKSLNNTKLLVFFNEDFVRSKCTSNKQRNGPKYLFGAFPCQIWVQRVPSSFTAQSTCCVVSLRGKLPE